MLLRLIEMYKKKFVKFSCKLNKLEMYFLLVQIKLVNLLNWYTVTFGVPTVLPLIVVLIIFNYCWRLHPSYLGLFNGRKEINM